MTTTIPKISIILPVYNVAQWLEQTITSLLMQSLQEWEAIFVIDGSPDHSEEILLKHAQHEPRIKVITQENKGQGAARNRGVEHALGEYLFFLDPDDVIPPQALQVAYERGVSCNADIVIGDYLLFRDGAEVEFKDLTASYSFHKHFQGLSHGVFSRKDIQDDLFFYHSPYFFVVWMKLFKRETWLRYGIRALEGVAHGEDFIVVKKMCFLSQRICIVDAVLVYYRKRAGSITTLRSEKTLDILKSYTVTRDMYKDLGLSSRENSLMHAAYLDWFYSHMVRFMPYSYWNRFFREMGRIVAMYDFDSLETNILGKRRLGALKFLQWPAIIGLPFYIVWMSNAKYTFKSIVALCLKFLGRIMPGFMRVPLLKLLRNLCEQTHATQYGMVLKKILFYLSV